MLCHCKAYYFIPLELGDINIHLLQKAAVLIDCINQVPSVKRAS